MKPLRLPRRPGQPVLHGRRYRAEIEVVYAGGSLPGGSYESLTGAFRAAIRGEISDLLVAVSSHRHNRVTVAATVRAKTPLAAITGLDAALDDALMATGLFEEFDVTGKVLRAGPLDHVWREPGIPTRGG